jgi:protein gp37
MTKEHKISWLNMPGYQPETWNPIVGCSKVSPGCDNCYAERMANRLTYALGGIGTGKNQDAWIGYSDVISEGKWTGKTAFISSAINKPFQCKTPRMIFVCSMGDIFHKTVTTECFRRVLDVILKCRQHIFVILTKRPENILPLMQRVGWGLPFPPNIWLGVTAENQEQANQRIPLLLQIPAAKRFVSIEPMLGPIELTEIRPDICKTITQNVLWGIAINENRSLRDGLPVLDWVICGGESGSKARPMHPDWVRSVRDQCRNAGTPFFFKQWGEWISEYPQGKNLGNMSQTYQYDKTFYKIGRKTAGDLLDGEQYHEWPEK